jgi:hypothetical protein
MTPTRKTPCANPLIAPLALSALITLQGALYSQPGVRPPHPRPAPPRRPTVAIPAQPSQARPPASRPATPPAPKAAPARPHPSRQAAPPKAPWVRPPVTAKGPARHDVPPGKARPPIVIGEPPPGKRGPGKVPPRPTPPHLPRPKPQPPHHPRPKPPRPHPDRFRKDVLLALRRLDVKATSASVSQNVTNTSVTVAPAPAPNVNVTVNPYVAAAPAPNPYAVTLPAPAAPAPPAEPVVLVPSDPAQPTGPAVSLGVRSRAQAGAAVQGEAEEVQRTRTIRLANATKQAVTVYVRYRAFNEEGELDWHPGSGEEVLKFELSAGGSADVKDGDWLVHASRARIWARGGGMKWDRFRDTDLPLVPEVDERGEGGYAAAATETFVFTIR